MVFVLRAVYLCQWRNKKKGGIIKRRAKRAVLYFLVQIFSLTFNSAAALQIPVLVFLVVYLAKLFCRLYFFCVSY